MSLEVVLKQTSPIPLNVRLSCGTGELLALVGPSGSGKTSALRAIAGLLVVRAGRVAVNGAVWLDTAAGIKLTPQQRKVGLVFQDYALMPHLTAVENIMLPLGAAPLAARRQRASDLLRLVNLEGLADRRPDALSGGQRQRVALARALARDPDVLLLDEPFSAVDQVTRERLKRELVALRARVPIPIVLVTHDLDEAMALADRIAVLHRGLVLATGTPDDVRLRPPTATVARLMGQTNVFRGRLLAPAAGGAPGRIAIAGTELEIARSGAFAAGAEIACLAPSEFIVLHRRGRPSQGERENPVTGIVVAIDRLGEQTAVSVRIDEDAPALINFRLPTHAARRNEIAVGESVTVSLLAEGLHLMAPET
ncbi:MAG: ABC transporter ATP-binding protein [Hyphomicrobiaceae bacterium]